MAENNNYKINEYYENFDVWLLSTLLMRLFVIF